MLFLIDLPRIDDSKLSSPEIAKERLTFFGQELLYFLEAMGLAHDVLRGVLQFDFAATENLAFVHTMSVSLCRRLFATPAGIVFK